MAHAYFRSVEQVYYFSWLDLLFYAGTLYVMYVIIDFLALLLQGYKARKVIKAINKISGK